MIKNICKTKHFIRRYNERKIYELTNLSLNKLIRYTVRIENLISCDKSTSPDKRPINIYKYGKIVIITDAFNNVCLTVFSLKNKKI